MTEGREPLPRQVGSDSVNGSIGVVIGSFLMLAASLLLLVFGWPAGPPADWLLRAIPGQLVGACGLFLSAGTMSRGLRGLRGKPRLVIDGDGILDLTSSRSPLVIPWGSVLEVSSPKKGYMDLRVRDQDEVIAALPLVRRQIQRVLAVLGRDSLRYGIVGFEAKPQQIIEHVRARVEQAEFQALHSRAVDPLPKPDDAT